MDYTNTQPNIPIVFEDEHLLVIDKPAGLLSQEDHTGDPDVLSLCKAYLKRSKSTTSTPYLGLLHRLDRPVSGLMLLAKNGNAAQVLSKQIRDRTIQKTYWTVCEGTPPPNGVLTEHLVKDRDRNVVEVKPRNKKEAKKALLSFATLEQQEQLNLLSIHLQTGRPHQIRVQLAAEGYPIWGDYKYGSNQPDGREMALRAVELVFEHPNNKQQMRFEVAPANQMPWSLFSITHM
jgi:23S rRNA pseudouridine1911/1915/1917 synthase